MLQQGKYEGRNVILYSLVLSLVFALVGPLAPALAQDDDVIDPAEIYSEELLDFIPQDRDYPSYASYIAPKEDFPGAKTRIDIDLASADFSEMDGEVKSNGLVTTDDGTVSFEFEVEEDALYELEISYEGLPGSETVIERSLAIDDSIPFAEAEQLIFRRVFQDSSQEYQEEEGNHTFPSQIEVSVEQTVRIRDQQGYYPEPLKFYLEEGEHTLSFISIKEPMLIKSLAFVPETVLPDYEEYRSTYADVSVIEKSQLDPIQAESALYKSSPSLYAINDRTSPKTTPYHPSYVRLNAIGGQAWNRAGDWLEWSIDIPETGLYELSLRYLQELNTGLVSTRRLFVNGEVPFQEANHLRFPYNSSWQVMTIGDEEGNPYLFYLEEGEQTLRLEVSLDQFAPIIHDVEQVAVSLNELARDITVITGSTPDPYRDYQLTQRIPHLITDLKDASNELRRVEATMHEIAGGGSDKTVPIQKAILQIDELVRDQRTIAKNLPSLQSNITSLGDWALNIKSQSLTLDVLNLRGTKDPLPPKGGNFLDNIRHEALAFVGSFTNDPSRISIGGEGSDSDESVDLDVWVSTGRDQMDVIRRLLGESFTSNARVNLRLVSPAVALSATAAGRGPDVIIQTDSSLPINFAFRGAGYDLSQFEDFAEVAAQVHPAALEGFEFEGGYYALPDQMSFPVLFYRSDILSDLQIPIPQTWEDILTIVPFLQNNNMEFFMEVQTMSTMGSAAQSTTKAINSIYLSMLYQLGGEIYNEKGSVALTDSPEAMAAFTQWLDYYTKHSFPVTMDFVTRFRLGQVPLAIVNFTNYTTLSVSAPEIRGDWGIAPIPGTRRMDGSIDRQLPAVTSAAMMIKPMVEKNNSAQAGWDFIKWWISADTQSAYAAEMESLLGSSARYPVSNMEAFVRSPWDKNAMDVLVESLEQLREIRQVPGSYITGRNIENAFYEVVNQPEDANIWRTINEWTENTNYEISSKRREFGLEVEEDQK